MVRQFLCQWGTNPVDTNPTPMQAPINPRVSMDAYVSGPSGSNDEPRWWTAEINALEVMRQAVGPGPVVPLQPSVIQGSGLPCSKLWAAVSWHQAGIGRRAVFDIGAGMRISAHTCSLELNIITPPECISVRGANPQGVPPQSLEGPGLFLDTIIRASVQESLAPVRGEALLTQTIFVPTNGVSVFVPCPPGAVALRISTPGPAVGIVNAGDWVEFGDPTQSTPPTGLISPVPFSLDCANVSCLSDRPGNAAGVATLNTSGVPRFFTYIWHLEF